MKDKILERKLKRECEKYGIEWDLIDFDALEDTTLTREENFNALKEVIKNYVGSLEEEAKELKKKKSKYDFEFERFKEQEKERLSGFYDLTFEELVNLIVKKHPSVIGVVGDANTGKSNLLYAILTYLNKKFDVNLFYYGLRHNLSVGTRFYSVTELEKIRDGLIVIDEFSSLFNLENRHNRISIEKTLRLVFHNNNTIILVGLPENFKKFLSSKVNLIIFKFVTYADFINGSRVKQICLEYEGFEAGKSVLSLKPEEAIVFDGTFYKKVKIPYIEEFDIKKNNKKVFREKSKNVNNRVSEKSPKFVKENKSQLKSDNKDL